MVYFPPQQKPADPIFRDLVSGSERRASWKEKTFGLMTDSPLYMRNGTAVIMTWKSQKGL